MALFSSVLDKVKLPIDISKKGKGHRSVIGEFSISGNAHLPSESFVKHLQTASNKVFYPGDLEKIALAVSEENKLSGVEVNVEFDLPHERLSSGDLQEITASYRGGYQCVLGRKRFKNYIFVEVPAVIQDIVPLRATVTILLEYRNTVPFFEDIMFIMDKTALPMDPPLTEKAKAEFKKKSLESKNSYSLMTELLDSFTIFPYIVSCWIQVNYQGLFADTGNVYTIEWKRK